MKNKKTKLVWEYFSAEIKRIFPYFIAFYLLSLFLAKISPTYKGFFYWPAFNIAILLLVLIYFITIAQSLWSKILSKIFLIKKIKINFRRPNFKFDGIKLGVKSSFKLCCRQGRKVCGIFFIFLKKIILSLKKLLLFIWQKYSWMFFAKIAIVIIILVLSLYYNITLPNFLTLAYALIAFLFVLDSRYAAGVALLCLAACPILLIYKKDAIAELFAVYAYYFLVITVVGALIEINLKKR